MLHLDASEPISNQLIFVISERTAGVNVRQPQVMAVLAQIVFASMLGKAGSNKLIYFLHRVSIISASVATILIKRFQSLGSQLADLFTIPYPANSARRVLVTSDNFTLLETTNMG